MPLLSQVVLGNTALCEGRTRRKEPEVRSRKFEAPAVTTERWVVRRRPAEKPGVVPETVLGIDGRCRELPLPGQVMIPVVVCRVKRIPEEVAVEPRVVLLKEPDAFPVLVETDLSVGTGALKRRGEINESRIRVRSEDCLFERGNGRIRVSGRWLGNRRLAHAPAYGEEKGKSRTEKR